MNKMPKFFKVLLLLSLTTLFNCTTTKKATETELPYPVISESDISSDAMVFDISGYATPYIFNYPPIRGYSNYGKTTLKNLQSTNGAVKTALVSSKWKDIETRPDVFNFKPLDDELDACNSYGIRAGVQFFVSPDVPSWLFLSPYNVPVVNTRGATGENSGAQSTVFPYYFNENYKIRVFKYLRACAEHLIKKYPNTILYWNSAEGTTGDVSPYKGDPVDSRYNISDAEWDKYKYVFWDSLNSMRGDWKLLLNCANNYRYLDTINKMYPEAGVKIGNAGHELDFVGSNIMGIGTWSRTETDANNAQRYSSFTNQINAALVFQSMVFSGKGVDIYCTGIGDVNLEAMSLFNKHSGGSGGVCVIHDCICYDDTERFNEDKYGAVIDPQKLRSYNASIQGLGESFADQYQIAQVLSKNINPSRKALIERDMSAKGALNMPDSLNKMDYGVAAISGCYEKGLYLINPNDQETFRRVGDRNGTYGQWTKVFKNGFFFSSSYFTTITFTYYDEIGNINVFATPISTGMVRGYSISGTGTKKFVKKTLFLNGNFFNVSSTLKVAVVETN